MNPTEKIVALMRGALNGTVIVRTFFDINQQCFTEVPVDIADVRVIFKMRIALTRIVTAEIDGAVLNLDDFDRAAWIPPRQDAYAEWWALMDGYTERTMDELIDDFNASLTRMKSFDPEDRSPAKSKAVDAFVDSFNRGYAYQPFAYLSYDEQTAFEDLLKRTPPHTLPNR